MRKVKIVISGGTAEEQADVLRSIAFSVQTDSEWLYERSGEKLNRTFPSTGNNSRYQVAIVEMADYDRKVLANAWLHAPAGRSVNKLARATQIECMRLYGILLGEKRATVKELNAICEELNISVESVKAENAES